MKTNLIILFLVMINHSFGQSEKESVTKITESHPFEDKIKIEIENKDSQYFYETLLIKIKNEPNDITKEEIKHLYYGQIYQKGTGLSFLDNPEDEYFRKAVYQNNCKKIINFGYKTLEKNPVELTTLMPICVCMLKRKIDDPNHLDNRLRMVLESIFETGDGKSKETAIKIANVEDDLVLKGLLGFKNGEESYDFLKNRVFSVWKNKNDIIYFEDSWTYIYNE